MIDKTTKTILTDCDGVMLNWEAGFITWMAQKGHNKVDADEYDEDDGTRHRHAHIHTTIRHECDLRILQPVDALLH